MWCDITDKLLFLDAQRTAIENHAVDVINTAYTIAVRDCFKTFTVTIVCSGQSVSQSVSQKLYLSHPNLSSTSTPPPQLRDDQLFYTNIFVAIPLSPGCLNFIKLCKMKYYNYCLFHSIQVSF